MTDIFKDYGWTSHIEPKRGISGKKIVRSIVASEENLAKFDMISSNGNALIHKSTNALWKFSDDRKRIEPLYSDDIITEDEL